MEFSHKSVLLYECIENLNIQGTGIYVDGTLGGAGHSLEICKKLSAGGRLVGIDTDMNAIENAHNVLKRHMDKVSLVHSNYSNFRHIISELDIKSVDGILLDLGVSSYQLDEPSRGFSYMHDARLDMRMDSEAEFSAYDVVNKYSQGELSRIIGEYGEERWAKRIASFIVAERAEKPIETTFELVSVIKKAVPKAARQDGPHPAKRTFQAIRIEVNSELEILKNVIADMVYALKPGGYICIITFHSLEDRIVKNAFRDLERPCTCPMEFPVCICGKKPVVEVVTRKPILPTEAELKENHRSRSAKLRVAMKVL